MMRVTCSRILKFSKPYFWLGTKSSSRGFNSRALPRDLISRIIAPSLRDVLPKQNRSFVQCRSVCYHAVHMANDYHQSVTIETFDALCDEGRVREAVKVLDVLKEKGYVVDLPRLLGLAKLCGDAEALEEARVVHNCITDFPCSHVGSLNTVIEMYLGCGSVDDALNVFDEMPERNLETWCIMIRRLAKNGEGELAIDMFTRFKEEGNKPDKEIFKAVFFACASLVDINEGLLHFQSMYRDYGIIPTKEVYVSVIEMLAACGHLDETLQFVETMAVEPSVEVWETLMNFCWVHGDLELGDRLAELVKKLDGTRMNKDSNKGLVAAKASDSAKEKLKQMISKIKFSRQREHMFTAGDTSHPESDKMIATLMSLNVQMLEMGHVPETRVMCYNGMVDEDREQQLLYRNPKLAFAHHILNSPARSALTVLQNFRICIDGHNTLKMISLITGRNLITRDEKRFHHFRNGVCSCHDYW